MSIVVKPYTFTVGATIIAAEHNSNFDTLYNDYNGNITNNNIAAGAGIEDTKLAQITTAGKVHTSAITPGAAVPPGGIIMWYGLIADIPTGWGLCDGTLYGSIQSPDLTDRFIIHADYDSGGSGTIQTQTSGGSRTISSANLPTHTHTYTKSNQAGASTADGVSGSPHRDSGNTTENTSNGGFANSDYLPKYYALAFIIKT